MKHLVLIGEMARRNVTIESISKLLNLHRNTISYKLNDGSFSIEEGCKIRDTFFPDWKIEELFRKEEQSNGRK